jgi:hypothetical protein
MAGRYSERETRMKEKSRVKSLQSYEPMTCQLGRISLGNGNADSRRDCQEFGLGVFRLDNPVNGRLERIG